MGRSPTGGPRGSCRVTRSKACVAASAFLFAVTSCDDEVTLAPEGGDDGAGAAATGGSGSGGVGSGAMGGKGGSPIACAVETDPPVDLVGPIQQDLSLTCDVVHRLVGVVAVEAGATLTIEPGTTVVGDIESGFPSTLVVTRGARLNAVGTPDAPIRFTSAEPPGTKTPGAWGGVALFGRARVNVDAAVFEGLPPDSGAYGGTEDDDSSGSLSYVVIEYGGALLAPNNEANGLTLGGVGRSTLIDFVQVRHVADDAIELLGGTVPMRHILVQHPADDGIDWDQGYRGRIQYAVVQHDPLEEGASHGLEGDNHAADPMAEPRSAPQIANITLVGRGVNPGDDEHYGLLLRNGTQLTLMNALVGGFDAGYDVQLTSDGIELTHSHLAFGALTGIAYAETPGGMGPLADDDGGYDEVAAFLGNTGNEGGAIEWSGDPYDTAQPGFFAVNVEPGGNPTTLDPWFEAAPYRGAFVTSQDRWDLPWARWSAP